MIKTQKGKTYHVKDLKLFKQGKYNVQLAEKNMLSLMHLRTRYVKERPFQNLRIGVNLCVTKETAVLVETLVAGGAKISLCSSNPMATQDDVAAYLASQDSIQVWAYKNESLDDFTKFLTKVSNFKPHIIIDDGGDLTAKIHHKFPTIAKSIIGGCEETTIGITRINNMSKQNILQFPVIAVNDTKTKKLVDNYYGTGQSTIDGIMRTTNTLFAGKVVVVSGYGPCGKGVSMISRGLGANVIVTEVNPFRALEAVYDGYRVMPISKAVLEGDIYITVTGNKNVIRFEHVKQMKRGSILANSGHYDYEIDVKNIYKNCKKIINIREYVEECWIDEKNYVYILSKGRVVNLSGAEGNPSEIMSTSFLGQCLACEYLLKMRGNLPKELIRFPEEMDKKIAQIQINSMNVEIDVLNEELDKESENIKK
ncbi:adenosylhomocysteinase [Anaeramoeba flamelloides]|uniref:Adenosylhomocysteinase n=1 Tax=Anaeramoeba flamelloides TaxID=1746091 RepID=A0ABQ8ZEE1_9EUKA|nr:adenosylhomocysteinase [Anaeramoeba flamelloides]